VLLCWRHVFRFRGVFGKDVAYISGKPRHVLLRILLAGMHGGEHMGNASGLTLDDPMI
jgi:hypothetical protein